MMTTGTMTETAFMDVQDYIDSVTAEGETFARAAEQGPLDVDIEPCPGWDMRELVRHLGIIHLWAAANVAYPKDDWLSVDDLPDLVGQWPELAAAWPDDTGLVGWYRACLANLTRVLSEAPPDHDCFTFLPAPTAVTMWSRRQASEIAIHRFDAEQARDITTDYEPAFASDMLDELLSGFTPRTRKLDVDRPMTMHVHAADTDDHWRVTFGPDRVSTSRHDDDADLVVRARATDLYLLFWNRSPQREIIADGDTTILDLWKENFRVRWV
jgi:uncharacterized protein (TIGR03083 family)